MKKTITALVAATALALTGCAAQEETATENIGMTLDVTNQELEGAFSACRNSSAGELKNYTKPDSHEPKFAYAAGDGVVIVGLTFVTSLKSGGVSALNQVLATCSMRSEDGNWLVDYKADMIPVVGGELG